MFDKPKGVAVDSFGNVYVVDSGWSNVQIFNRKAQVLLFFGGRGPIPGMMKNPTAIAIDRKDNIYVADYLNHRVEQYRLVNTVAADSFLEPVVPTKGGDATGKPETMVKPSQKTQESATRQ
jgi:DNA-binding beta-propeller fold protein YncE